MNAVVDRAFRRSLDDSVELVTGRNLRVLVDEMIDRERAFSRGLGPFERDRLLAKAPDRIRRELRLAAQRPQLVGVSPSFQAVVGQPSANPSSYTAVNTTNVETVLWTAAIWTPIAANDAQTGKVYQGNAGGVLGTSSVAPTALWTPRYGTTTGGVTLGATTATTMIASLSAVPWSWQFTLAIRALGLAAGATAGTGNGYIIIGGLTTAAGIVQSMGGTVASTIDTTTAQGLVLTNTWGANALTNTVTCQWTAPVLSFN